VIVAGHTVRRITAPMAGGRADDAEIVQALFALDPHYWEHVEGAPLRENEAAIALEERPPSVPIENKHAFLVDDVALLDMLEGYPDEHTWFLGLIFLAPSVRGRGLGTRLMHAVRDHARSHGARALRLAVATQHPDARRLYERLGFQFVDLRKRTIYTGDVIELAVLELRLD
jgi:GNAT superfamily N-acetyltransferase